MKRLRRKLLVLFASVLLTLAVAFAASHRSTLRQPVAAGRVPDRTAKDSALTQSQQSLAPASIVTVDRKVIAGGGGTSTGGNFRLDGTVAEVSASNTQTGGPYALAGGYWNTLTSAVAATPTPTPAPTASPTPTPTPTATPTPTPTPSPTSTIQLLLDESGPDPEQAVALDSVLFLRDPFKVVNDGNFFTQSTDRNTRVMLFAANLLLAQGEPPSMVMINLIDANNQSYNIPAEDVRLVPGFDFTQVVFRLPDNLAVGRCTVTISFHSQFSNSGTIRIRI